MSDRGVILDIAFSKLAQQAGSDEAAYSEWMLVTCGTGR